MENKKPYSTLFPISSFIYRLSIIVLAITIILTQENLWTISIYWGLIATYLCLITLCYNFRYAELRSIVDFLFINLVLWSKSIAYPINYFFILVPIASSVFYTGKHKSIFAILVLTWVTLFIHDIYPQNLSSLLPPLLLYMMCYLYEGRRQWLSNSQELNNIIDGAFFDRDSIVKPHKVFPIIIDRLNSFIDSTEKHVRSISIYIISNSGRVFLINASEFVWHRELKLSLKEIEYLREKHYFSKLISSVDGFSDRYYYIKIEESEYIVQIGINGSLKLWFLFKLGLAGLLERLAGKITRMFDIRYKVIQQQERDLTEARKTKDYIDKAINVVHFIRNKMTAIVNVIEYLTIPKAQRNEASDKSFDCSVTVARRDIGEIKKMANKLLDSSNYPFSDGESQEIKIIELFMMLSETVEGRLDESVELVGTAPSNKSIFRGNRDELKVLFTDWVSNMEKYGTDPKIEFRPSENNVEIVFSNVSVKQQALDVEKLIKVSDYKTSLTTKKTHGIVTMKEIANNYKIKLSTQVNPHKETEKVTLVLKISIPIYEPI